MLRLPPLNALRAFESAARLGGYVAAAEELNVSAAAISQHIRNLEQFLGKTLFIRLNNRVLLSDAGEEVFKNIHQAFQDIANSTSRVMGVRPRARLIVSGFASACNSWLGPELARFARLHPDFRFDLRIEDGIIDYTRNEFDLRLSYGEPVSTELEWHFLYHEELLPMCAPSYLTKLRKRVQDDLTEVPDEDLIHIDWGQNYGSRSSWQDWFNRFARGRLIEAIGHQTSHTSVALDLAARGLGVALGEKLLAAEMLREGKLVILSPHGVKLGHSYNLVHARAKAHKPMLQALIAFLIKAVAA